VLDCNALIRQRLVFGVEEGLLQHSQQYDATNPKLNSQQIPPLRKGNKQPNDSKYNVNNAHDQIELGDNKHAYQK